MNLQLPNKSHFKINEVCSLTGVKPYVLRFWESEFPEIKALTSSSGQKLYDHEDVQIVALIKHLLFDKKMTVEEAKAEIKLNASQFQSNTDFEIVPELPEVNQESVFTIEPERDLEIDSPVSISISDKREQSIPSLHPGHLMAAKERLNDLLSLTNALKERHNWN